MAEAEDRLQFCKQALGELGTRSTITSLDPPDGSQEAYYCNLFFEDTRNQVLRAAHWNFAGVSDTLVLWKAQPGTPENPTTPESSWSSREPAPGWLYSYTYPPGQILQTRRVIAGRAFVPFEIANDNYDRAGNRLEFTSTLAPSSVVTIDNPGTGYVAGRDYMQMTQEGALIGQFPVIRPLQVDSVGRVLIAEVVDGGTFVTHGTGILIQAATNGDGTGFTFTGEFIQHPGHVRVILTNGQNAIGEFTKSAPIALFDPLFADTLMVAFEAKLALALLGDRAIYGAKLQEANNSILTARVRDGNEGLTTYSHVPDWLQVRGVSSMLPTTGWQNPSYGPLFSV